MEKFNVINQEGKYITRKTIGSEYSLTDNKQMSYLFDDAEEANHVMEYCYALFPDMTFTVVPYTKDDEGAKVINLSTFSDIEKKPVLCTYTYTILKDGIMEKKFTAQYNDQCVFEYIHSTHSYSIDHAIKHEGYLIVVTNEYTGKHFNFDVEMGEPLNITPELLAELSKHSADIQPIIILDYSSSIVLVVDADIALEDDDMIEAVNEQHGYSFRLKDIHWMQLIDREITLLTTIQTV